MDTSTTAPNPPAPVRRVSSSPSFWNRERAIAVAVVQALIAVAAGASAAVGGHPAGAPIGGGAGLLAVAFGFLVRQGVFSQATVATIGKDAELAASVGAALQSHSTDMGNLLSGVVGDLRGAISGNLSPVVDDVSTVRSIVTDLAERLPRRTGHEGFAALAPWADAMATPAHVDTPPSDPPASA